MYEEFYGFRDHPFRLTPDPTYLFLSANHQEALGHLLFGVKEGSGVVVITGEIGAGKTTLLRTLVRNLDEHTIVAYIFNPALSAIELLQTINAELGLPSLSLSKKELIDDLNRFLLAQQAAERKVVVIVDEAQDLEPSVLEQLRLLSNLETERAKLLQIMLVGQPELRDILARPDLAQLDQRVTLRWHLGPLNKEETAAYVPHRIRVAADGQEPVRFTDDALATIYRFSKGIPRLINIVCHRALLIGYTREERRLDRLIVLQAVQELGRRESAYTSAASSRFSSPLWLGAGLMLGTILLVTAYRHWQPSAPEQEAALPTNRQVIEEVQPLTPTPLVAPPPPTQVEPTADKTVEEAQVAATPLPPPPLTKAVGLAEQAKLTAAPAEGQAEQPPSPPVATPQPSPPLEEQAFLQELQQATVLDSAVQAANNLLQAWQASPLKDEEWRNGTMDLNAIASVRRLEYLPVNGALSLLTSLDLPAILEFTTPARHEPRFALIVGVTDNHCHLRIGTHNYRVSLSLLTEYWFGKAHLLWKDFENVGSALTVGSVGHQVQRLQTLLSQALGLGENLPANVRPGSYSRRTEALVARFQKSKRLAPDGIIGPRTMIALYNELPQYHPPNLQKADAPAQTQSNRGVTQPDHMRHDAQGQQQREPDEHNS
jgi:general secretion pathway protein A